MAASDSSENSDETRKRTQGLVTQILLRAIDDPIEGDETRRRAVIILNDDPGQNPAEWERKIAAHIQGGGR